MDFTRLVQFCNILNIKYETIDFKDICSRFAFTYHNTEYIFGKMVWQECYQCTNRCIKNEEIKQFIHYVVNSAK